MNAIVPTTQAPVAASSAVDASAMWLAMIERAARDPAIDIVKLERMIQLRAAEEARRAAQLYREAMAACQSAMNAIRADCTNPQTRSRYASLAAVDAVARPIYTAHGFSLSFDTADIEKPDHVRVVCTVAHAAGHAENFHIDMPCDGKGIKGNAMMTATHSVASAISYSRRYLLSMIFHLCIETDDDGNAAGGRQRQATAPAGPVAETDHEMREAFLSTTRERIRKATDWKALGTWWNSPEQKKARRDFDLTKEEVAGLVAFVTARINKLKNPAAA